jgi:hypothetical protein
VPDDSRDLRVCFVRISQVSLLLISICSEDLDSPGNVINGWLEHPDGKNRLPLNSYLYAQYTLGCLMNEVNERTIDRLGDDNKAGQLSTSLSASIISARLFRRAKHIQLRALCILSRTSGSRAQSTCEMSRKRLKGPSHCTISLLTMM